MKNGYEVRGEVTAIFLNKRDGSIVETLIDTALLPKAQEFEGMWCHSFQHRGYYVTGRVPGFGDKGRMYRLHRWITDSKESDVIDHINGNTMDNRLCNLRKVDYVANGQNRTRKNKNNTSGHRGVTWDKRKNKWFAQVYIKGKTIGCGYYDNLEDAANAAARARQEKMPFSKEAEQNVYGKGHRTI